MCLWGTYVFGVLPYQSRDHIRRKQSSPSGSTKLYQLTWQLVFTGQFSVSASMLASWKGEALSKPELNGIWKQPTVLYFRNHVNLKTDFFFLLSCPVMEVSSRCPVCQYEANSWIFRRDVGEVHSVDLLHVVACPRFFRVQKGMSW